MYRYPKMTQVRHKNLDNLLNFSSEKKQGKVFSFPDMFMIYKEKKNEKG